MKIYEEDFQSQVVSLAETLGWTWVHWRPLRTKHGWQTPYSGPLGKGWPDLTLVHQKKQRVVFAELKSEKGVVLREQHDVINFLRTAGQEAFIWRPSDFQHIVEVLSAGSDLRPQSGASR